MEIASLLSVIVFPYCFTWLNLIAAVPVPTASTNDSNQSPPFTDYDDDSENYIVIDDMIIQRDSTRAGFVNYAWPNGIVPFRYERTITAQQRRQIAQAMSALQSISCIVFRPINAQDRYNILFRNQPGQGCSSIIGWQNRRDQPVQLETGCSVGNAVHELLHALGFFHEHTRDDRDNFVRINFRNIQPGRERNFQKDGELFPNDETSYFNVPYNYDSIMHYGATFFTSNGENTIDVLNNPNALGNGNNIGQRDRISEGDQEMLRAKYNCPNDASQTNAPDGGLQTTEVSTTQNTPPIICQYQPSLPVCRRNSTEQTTTLTY